MQARVALARVYEVGRRERDRPVPQPVGRGGERHAFGADVEREDLAHDDPCDRAPCRGEETNVNADERDEHLLTVHVRCGQGYAGDGDDELANAHANGSDDEQFPTPEPLHTVDTGDGHAHIDDVGRDSDQEGITDARVLEEEGAEIEYEVDSGELLPGLKTNAR